MLVPRSFKYSSSPMMDVFQDKPSKRRSVRKTASFTVDKTIPPRPTTSHEQATTEPPRPPSRPVAVPKSDKSNHGAVKALSSLDRRAHTLDGRRRKPKQHDPHALPPSVAALLAVTSIPPRNPNRFRRKSSDNRRISIDELVSEWKSDSSLSSVNYSSSPALTVLLEDVDESDQQTPSACESIADEEYFSTRCTSCESIPSLEADSLSMPSVGSPITPESLRSHRSMSNLKRQRSRSSPVIQGCSIDDHPLAAPAIDEDEDEDLVIYKPGSKVAPAKPKKSFTSNLTTSLQAIKNAAINSISSFGKTSPTSMTASANSRSSNDPFYDDMLWSHPFLFPRLSSESRPAEYPDHVPSATHRHYLNPTPLTFEEQEAPFQQALHAPFLAEQVDDLPHIQMQTYNRLGANNTGNRRKSSRSSRSSSNPQSEAGRAMLEAGALRAREPRENSDFLRVVVLEMNMRREGKLESGRAKIWLPARPVVPGQGTTSSMTVTGKPPRRWIGESAY